MKSTGPSRGSSCGPSWWSLLAFGVAIRVATFGVGLLLHRHAPPLPWIETSPFVLDDTGLALWYHWDAQYYLGISQRGYEYVPGQYSSAAFMPALPALMHLSTRMNGDTLLLGILIPNLCFVLGLAVFGKYVALVGRDGTLAWKTCALLAAFPTAFFFGMPYGESLGFLAAAVAIYAWELKRTGTAATAVFLGSFARLTTLMLPAAFGLDWVANKMRERGTSRFTSVLVVSLAGLLSVGLFCLYMHFAVGDAMAHLKAHDAWNRKPPHPLNIGRTLMYLFVHYPKLGLWNQVIPEALALTLFTLLGLRALFVRGTLPGLLILLPILQALLTGTPLSLERIVLASFVAFLDLAQMLKTATTFWTVLGVFVLLQLLLLNGYLHQQFVG